MGWKLEYLENRAHRVYEIYCDCSDDLYIGATSVTLHERLLSHKRRARYGSNAWLYKKMRELGKEHFHIRELCWVLGRSDAFDLEAGFIALKKPSLNMSKGGKYDLEAATKIAQDLLANDNEYRKWYIEKLREGIAKSEKTNSPEAIAKRLEGLKKWQAAHPREAYKIQRRATRCSRRGRQKIIDKAPNKMQSIRRRKNAVKKVWANRTEQQKKELAEKIRQGVLRANARKSKEEKAANIAQLKEARKKINHEYRKKRQKEALEEYWTEEKRKEFGNKVRARNEG